MRLSTVPKVLLAGALALTTMGAVAAPAAASPARQPTASEAAEGTLTSSVQGTFTDADGGLGQATGTFTPTEFAVQDGRLVALGTLHAVLTDATGATVGTAEQAVTLPVQTPETGQVSTLAACTILHLVLGPLDLNLLGLLVHLDRVVLDISAQPGPGNLLGNLLCAIAGLLNGGGALSQIAALLNQVLAILGL
ncbi:hypothetical protein [Actinoplanes regularis]|uniref:hypothetical protein n=1 Tax=Actinoplanes regularis TaxID=52697 RepID=UPI002554E558|nr:hypothetical protein [Actinoplanes regularis]GLW27765.1 hypothetical protein Areg01_07050 [Actinoplanes regularis]